MSNGFEDMDLEFDEMDLGFEDADEEVADTAEEGTAVDVEAQDFDGFDFGEEESVNLGLEEAASNEDDTTGEDEFDFSQFTGSTDADDEQIGLGNEAFDVADEGFDMAYTGIGVADEDFEVADENLGIADEGFEDAEDIEDGISISMDESGLLDGTEYVGVDNSGFINEDGELQVMEISGNDDVFETIYVPIDKICIAANRIRKNPVVDDLILSIKNNGLVEPIVVAKTQTEGIYVLVHGFRRLMACAMCGIKRVPCILNKKIRTLEIPIIEAIYNHTKPYNMDEVVDYIDYLEREKGIVSPSMIEHLLMMDNGDYAKLKDILDDNDPDIVEELMSGRLTIAAAFKKLEQKRKKQSKEEKLVGKAAKVYGDAESGASDISDSGEIGDETAALTRDEIKELMGGIDDLDSVDDEDLASMVEESNSMEGYGYDKQTPGAREGIDPAIRKAVLTRDGAKCLACGFGGPGLESCIDIHHYTMGVAQGQDDDPEGCCCLCITCHMSVELWAYGRLPVTGIDEMDEDQKRRMKKIIKIGNIKRNALIKLGKKRDDIKKEGAEATRLRRMPGASQPRG